MNFTLISAAVALACGFGAAWQIRGAQITQLELDYANTRIAQQKTARATIERTTTTLIKAQNNASTRAIEQRRTAALADTEHQRLLNAIADALRDTHTTLDACTERATAIGGLLAECSSSYKELGTKADRHVSDLKTLSEAWPK